MHMKNITFSAKEESIERARKVASLRHRTLNELFREWLDTIDKDTGMGDGDTKTFTDLWRQANYLQVGKKLSREEMNER